jgi:RNA polymerase sigma factor (sigma-70 family)
MGMSASDAEADADLVRRARDGAADAVDELLRRHLSAAYLVALGVVRNTADAEDVAQEAFIACLDRLEECRRPDRFVAWLLQAVRNRARNCVRSRALRAAEPLEAADDTPRAASRIDPAEQAELRERLLHAIAELSEIQRQVVLLHDVEGYPHPVIADILGLSYDMSRQHLSDARRRLRARLGGAMEEYRRA